jgi:hypothetical protein
MKLAFDQQTDYSNKELYSMFVNADLPEYVKTAELDDSLELSELPKTAFADSERRIYPINTPARVFVSNAYFINKKADISKLYGEDYTSQLENNIKEAAEIFDIVKDLDNYSSKFNEKTASDYSERYLTEFDLGEANPVQLYPIKTAGDLTECANHFVKNIKNYPFDVRVKTAQNIVKFAEELDVIEIPELVMKYAGLYYPDLENLGGEIRRRATKLTKEANKKVYEDVAKDVSNVTEISEVMKIAEVMFYVENMEGLYDKTAVANVLGDPVDCIFTKSIEKVSEDLAFIDIHGDKYKISDLTKISRDKYEEAFGFELDPEDVEKLAEILPTMPRSDVKLFEEISGIRPIH